MRVFYLIVIACLIAGLTGCERVSMPYVMKTDRTDQDLKVGNRGYLKGTPPPSKDRGDLKRPFIAVDVDLVEPAPTVIKEEVK